MTTSQRRLLWLLVTILLLIISTRQQKYKYSIYIDCGSSGSRIHVYKFDSNLKLLNEVFEQDHKGVSEYSDPIQAKDAIIALLHHAFINIPTRYYSTTPIALKATAGLRKLDPSKAKNIILSLSTLIKSLPFKFHSVDIMDGKDEAIFAWITINYLSKNLASKTTAAILDLGGASTQIVFQPSEIAKYNNQVVKLSNRKYNLFQYSYLGYGLNEAVKTVLKDTNTKKENSCNDYDTCKSLVLKNLFSKQECEYDSCSFNNVYQPDLNLFEGDIYAFSYFYDKTIVNETKTVEDVGDQAKDVCKKLSEKDSKDSKDPKDCVEMVYLYSLLSVGYHLKNERRLVIEKKINGVEVGWCLGAALQMFD